MARKEESEQLFRKVNDFLRSAYADDDEQSPEVKSESSWYPADNWPNKKLIVNTPEEAFPLYEENQGAAFECCRKFRKLIGHRLPREDYSQIVLKCLWGAALMYDKKYEVKFVSFLWTVCERRCRYEINRFYYKPGQYMSAVAEIWEDIQKLRTNSEGLTEVERVTFESVIELNLKVNTLREAEIVIEHLLFGHTLEECGKKHKITRERVRQIEVRAINRIRENFGSFKGNVKLIH